MTTEETIMHQIIEPRENKFNVITMIIVSFSSGLMIVMFTFLWNLKGDMATLVERDKARTERMDKMEEKVNKLELNYDDLRIRVTHNEDKLTLQYSSAFITAIFL
jgi:hypothetical protein